jgi:hypothetical protein
VFDSQKQVVVDSVVIPDAWCVQIGLKCIVLNSQDVSEFDVDEGGLFINNMYLQGADWNFEHDRLAESKYVSFL